VGVLVADDDLEEFTSLLDMQEGDGFLGSFCVFAQHGLLIFRDVESTDRHNGFDGRQVVHAAADSIYLAVRPSVDGPVAVDVFDDGSDDFRFDEALLFDGVISSKHGQFVALGVGLAPRRVHLPGGAYIDVDGASDDPPVLVET
jgi:hypothetical protein